MKPLSAAACLALLSLSACMTPPTAEQMANVPVVTFGQAAPANKNFVLYYPAGVALPVEASVNGTLLAKPAGTTLQVSLKHDVFVYRQWVSYDGKIWFNGQDKIGSRFRVTLPGEPDGANPGTMTASFDEK